MQGGPRQARNSKARAILLAAFLAMPLRAAAPADGGAAMPLAPLRTHAARRAASQALAPLRVPADGLWLVRFGGPIRPAQRRAVAVAGVRVLEYVPDHALLVQAPHGRPALAALGGALAVEPLLRVDKLSPELLDALDRGTALPASALAVDLEGHAETVALATREALLALAARPDVRWVAPRRPVRVLNDVGSTIIGAPHARFDTGRYGSGQIVALCDSGLDTGDLGTLSADFAPRVVATHPRGDSGSWADPTSHGTHVAGTIAGSGVLSGAHPASHAYDGSFAGVAPEASLVVQEFDTDSGGDVTSGLPADYYGLFLQAYADGARIQSESWGGLTGDEGTEAEFGAYPYESQRTDQFLWDHPDSILFAAAGNAGFDSTFDAIGNCNGDGDGVTDLDGIYAPATAKNVVAVGASESLRPTGHLPYGTWYGFGGTCFAAEPIRSDFIADRADGMMAYSSRGPCDDGRIKPDLVAPGTEIVSARSHAPGAGILFGVHETNPDYLYCGGTSNSTPFVAGAAALVREELQATGGYTGGAVPSGAVIKALLLAGAASMGVGQYGGGATQEIPLAVPNPVNGWGRADLSFLLPGEGGSHYWFDDHATGLVTDDQVTYTTSPSHRLHLARSGPLRVVLAWIDPPASLIATAQLVDDLDLVVVGPDATVHLGNGGNTADRVNNVESVVLDDAPPGDYVVTVTAHAVNAPDGATQPYALAVVGGVDSLLLADGFEAGSAVRWDARLPQ